MRLLSQTFRSVKLSNPNPAKPSSSSATSRILKSQLQPSPNTNSKSRSWCVYLIVSTNTPIKTYVGVTTDFSRRYAWFMWKFWEITQVRLSESIWELIKIGHLGMIQMFEFFFKRSDFYLFDRLICMLNVLCLLRLSILSKSRYMFTWVKLDQTEVIYCYLMAEFVTT